MTLQGKQCKLAPALAYRLPLQRMQTQRLPPAIGVCVHKNHVRTMYYYSLGLLALCLK